MEIDDIVNKYKEKELIRVIFDLEDDVARLEDLKDRKQQVTDYINSAKGVLFFLKNGIKPAGLNDVEFQKMKPLIENLVEKRNLNKEVMSYFE